MFGQSEMYRWNVQTRLCQVIHHIDEVDYLFQLIDYYYFDTVIKDVCRILGVSMEFAVQCVTATPSAIVATSVSIVFVSSVAAMTPHVRPLKLVLTTNALVRPSYIYQVTLQKRIVKLNV